MRPRWFAWTAGCVFSCAGVKALSTMAPSTKTLPQVLSSIDNSLKTALRVDPNSERLHPNKEPREVFGQYVEVTPTPLPEPYLVAISPDMAREIGLDPAEAQTEAFVKLFSGVSGASPEVRPWATPYAVSVFGQPILSPDPFGRGNGYGDGRALSLGEFVAESGARWELQLKGSGTTPFSRGGDGRAVLRSSIREFLVSECMDAMGVPTTRALCLIASGSEYTRRLWYAPTDKSRDHPPDTLITERCAITCRAAPSFVRVGHVELWSRRTARGEEGAAAELRALLEHALRREFADVDSSLPLRAQLIELARTFAQRQAELAVHWLRVGYVQGNMNSDNCLLSGRTMDYGPFGFVEQYEPLWSPFTSDMERKFGFERQPLAAQVNVMTLVRAMLPLFERMDDYDDAVDELQAIVKESYADASQRAKDEMLRAKLGLAEYDAYAAESLYPELHELMTKSAVDFTLVWRQLSHVSAADAAAAAAAAAAVDGADSAEAGEAAAAEEAASHGRLLAHLEPCFYEDVPGPLRKEWAEWLTHYATRLHADGRDEATRVAEQRATSPKYIPREWMLANAYTAAERGDHSVVQELFGLFRTPFYEHPELEAKYYRRTPEDVRGKAGISYFS